MHEATPMQPGRVEVIAGPMFAGKTEELLRRERRALIAGRRVQVFTHRLDTRRGTDRIASHAGLDHPCYVAGVVARLRTDPSIGTAAFTVVVGLGTRRSSSPRGAGSSTTTWSRNGRWSSWSI
jgi:Thymidine kinase